MSSTAIITNNTADLMLLMMLYALQGRERCLGMGQLEQACLRMPAVPHKFRCGFIDCKQEAACK